MLKAAREAKLRTSWTDPDSAYEAALTAFVGETLEPSEDAPFLFDVARLVARIAASGFANSLARVVIHLTAPGTPDLYQGDELWNFTLVDPDNRGQVDYDARMAALDRLEETARRLSSGAPIDLTDNGLKLLVTHRLLDARRANAGLFTAGQYEPLSLRGARAEHVIAFARMDGARAIVTIAPRLVAELEADAKAGKIWWGDTTIHFPDGLHARAWRSAITGQDFPGMAEMLVADLLGPLPIAVLMS
jgi:(1->4)-alpha-D-glucan 1-alpha-D-glucosylmutase